MCKDEKRKIIERVMCTHGFTLHGFCTFDWFFDRIIPCRAATHLKEAFCCTPPKTIICVLFPYRFDDRIGNISRYAQVPDYHMAAGGLLLKTTNALKLSLPQHIFLSFIDNSPISEVVAASLAGLGCIGDNGLLINPTYGSWVFIGTIVTDIPLDLSAGVVTECTHCGACYKACPGNCIGKSRENCISRLTQLKGELSESHARLIKKSGMVWGCDFCQDACPMNAKTLINPHTCFNVRYSPNLTKESLSDLQDKAYAWRGIDVLNRNLNLFKTEG